LLLSSHSFHFPITTHFYYPLFQFLTTPKIGIPRVDNSLFYFEFFTPHFFVYIQVEKWGKMASLALIAHSPHFHSPLFTVGARHHRQ
ncbi:TPA: hypothetical protein ACIYKF_004689, partial [Escherichia coli]